MTDSFVIQPNDTIAVTFADLQSYVNVLVEQPSPWGVVTVAGPQGATGPAGPSYTGVAWFFGEGEPGTILGSKPGDFFLSTDTGVIYVLGGN